MKTEHLVAKYINGNELSKRELSYLRENLTRELLERLATAQGAQGLLARKLHKLGNILHSKVNEKNHKKAEIPIATSASKIRTTINKMQKAPISGGGVNNTGKKR